MVLNHSDLIQACTPGGASVLSITTELRPAAGPHAGVAPPRYVRGSQATYAYETRYVSGDPSSEPTASTVVVLDSKGSAANRVEEALARAIRDQESPLDQTPRIELTYAGTPAVYDCELPHRFSDGHLRAGTVDGEPVTKNPAYLAARNVTTANVLPLLELSGVSPGLGAWDATRRSHQVRLRSCLVGETIGVLADQSPEGRDVAPRGAARFDTIAPSVRLSAEDMRKLLDDQRDELSKANVDRIEKAITKAKKGTTSAAALGLGAIPPSLDGLGLVACSRIIRSHVLSFSALRQMRFGLGAQGDAAARALIAALLLNGLVRSYAELTYRANCDLVEAERPKALLDARYGEVREVELPDIQSADGLLEEAITAARAAGVRWEGQVLHVTGNPHVAGGIEADADDAQE